MTEERKTYWSCEELWRIVGEEAVIGWTAENPTGVTISAIEAAPPGLTRTQVLASLRALFAIPEDDGR